MIVAEKQRAMRLSNKRLQQSIARLIKALEKELASLDTDIDATVRGSPAWREKEDILISLVAVRHNPQMKSFYERLVGAGKAKIVALIAVARKLAVLLNAILRDKRR